MTISVVVVTWNAKKYVRECLSSLCDQDRPLNTEIIVVDNASSDGTPELVRLEFPSVRLIANTTNLGCAAGNNVGIRKSRGEYVCLVNSDVNAPPDCIRNVIDFMEHNRDVGLSGPRMLGPDGSVRRST